MMLQAQDGSRNRFFTKRDETINNNLRQTFYQGAEGGILRPDGLISRLTGVMAADGKTISYHVRRVLQPVSHVYGQGIGRCICVDVPEVHLDSFAYDIGRYPAAIVSAFLQDDRNGTSGDMLPAAADALRSIVHGTNDINRVGIPISYVTPHSFVLTHYQ